MEEGCSVHAYVLMSNHVHLLLTPVTPGSVSRMMKRVGESYVPRYNGRHDRTGTLWEGRFKSAVVDSESYVLECQRYIELNPVRAGMVMRPRDYPWSSHRANAEGEPSLAVTPHPAYLAFAADAQERYFAYRKWFGEKTAARELDLIRRSINGGIPLGSDEFIARLEGQTGRRLGPNKGGRPRKKTGV